MKNPNKAFTLIELLVVIAIIGILSSVVLASLSGARESAREANILSSLNNANTQATLYYNQNGSYNGLCSDSKIQSILSSLQSTTEGAKCFEAQSNNYGVYIEGGGANLAQRDWGIGVKSDGNYYVGSPFGSGRMADASESTGTDWDNAKSLCSDAGGRLASPSALAALYQIDGDTPDGFAVDYHWSALESGAPSGEAWSPNLELGSVSYGSKSYSNDAHCAL